MHRAIRQYFVLANRLHVTMRRGGEGGGGDSWDRHTGLYSQPTPGGINGHPPEGGGGTKIDSFHIQPKFRTI